ncbi:MAG: hypothetical protein AAGD11_01695 [Planctomycetota bacterium]
MNLLGKILTVAIMIAAVLLVCVSVMVYATHKNWKTEADSLKQRLADQRAQNQQLQSKKDALESQLKAEVEAAQQDVRKLESERVQLIGQNSTIQKQLDGLLQEQRKNLAAVASTQANNEVLTREVADLRVALSENQQKRDEAVRTTVDATDKLHQAQGKLSTLVERNKQLTLEVATKTSLLREKGIDPSAKPGEIVPQVRGIVSASRRDASGQMIEITVGADDGLRKGHTVEIYRGQRYLGRAEIIKTEPDRAVARVIRKFQQGPIQERDNVATKLRVG